MAKLDLELSKEAFEKLDDARKEFYTQKHDGSYELDGVGALIRAEVTDRIKKAPPKAELLTELDELRDFKSKHEQAEVDAESAKRVAEGKYKEDLEAKEAAWKERLDAAVAEKDSLFSSVHRERLTNELVKRGVLADRAEYLVDKLVSDTELVKSDTGFDLRKKGGIGDATEFDGVINAAKEKTPFFFAANGASGSGASPSHTTPGGVDLSTLSPIEMLNQANSAKAQ